jgi:dTDP-4-amino-4,6-dideoxygalactose transaminase
MFAKRTGSGHALAVNSGTSALFAAVAALGIGPGDEVIVPGYGFIGTYSSVLQAWAVPVLAEIDQTFNIDPEDVKAKITPRTKAIMPVSMLGNPARLDVLKAIADEHGLFMIEDCCQACGATYKGKAVGTYGNAGAFSFNTYKPITSAEGGMIITDDQAIYDRCFALQDQGYARDPKQEQSMIGENPIIGYDLKYTELQAAVLVAQLRKLDGILSLLRANKRRYKEQIGDIPGLEYRDITDVDGECGTVLGAVFSEEKIARAVAAELDTEVVEDTGWHVYSNMDHFMNQRTVWGDRTPWNHPEYRERGGKMEYHQGMLPRTDDLLRRSINISIGVADPGLGTQFGVNVLADEEEIDTSAARFREVARKHLG